MNEQVLCNSNGCRSRDVCRHAVIHTWTPDCEAGIHGCGHNEECMPVKCSGALNNISVDNIVIFLESNFDARRTGSTAWGVSGPGSDIDVMVSAEQDIAAIKAHFRRWGWIPANGKVATSRGAIRFVTHNKSVSAGVDLIVLPKAEFERRRLATDIMLSAKLSSRSFNSTIKNKRLRVGFFEGLCALLRLIGL